MNTATLRIGGVPEHFNLPWLLAIESGALANLDVNASWTDFPSGTGSMVQAFADGNIDIAMLLTEGALKAKAQGANFEIIGFYTQSPLLWSIHVPSKSNLYTLEDLAQARYAISRFGSGSHLMAFLLASQQEQELTDESFEIINNMNGARELFSKGGDFVFLWEKFMTQPMVDAGEFRRIGEIPTPWPCFVICVDKKIYAQLQNKITQILQCVLDTAEELKQSPIAAKLIASRYHLKIDSTTQWLDTVEWSKSLCLDENEIKSARSILKNLKLL